MVYILASSKMGPIASHPSAFQCGTIFSDFIDNLGKVNCMVKGRNQIFAHQKFDGWLKTCNEIILGTFEVPATSSMFYLD